MDELVSIYVPTRNRSKLLARCLESICNQSYRDIEILVVDDASDDETPAVLDLLASSDPRIRVFRQVTPSGAPAARNVAIRSARGRYLTGIDDDDVMLQHRIKTLITAFDPQYSLICTGFVRQTKHGRITLAKSRRVIDLDAQLMRNHVGNAAFSLTTRFIEAGMFDETMPAWQDYDLWTRMISAFGPALRLNDASHVVHEDHDSLRISANARVGAARFIDKHQHLMSVEHRTSQALETFMLSGQRMSPIEMLRLSTTRTRGRALRYMITSNFPAIRSLRR